MKIKYIKWFLVGLLCLIGTQGAFAQYDELFETAASVNPVPSPTSSVNSNRNIVLGSQSITTSSNTHALLASAKNSSTNSGCERPPCLNITITPSNPFHDMIRHEREKLIRERMNRRDARNEKIQDLLSRSRSPNYETFRNSITNEIATIRTTNALNKYLNENNLNFSRNFETFRNNAAEFEKLTNRSNLLKIRQNEISNGILTNSSLGDLPVDNQILAHRTNTIHPIEFKSSEIVEFNSGAIKAKIRGELVRTFTTPEFKENLKVFSLTNLFEILNKTNFDLELSFLDCEQHSREKYIRSQSNIFSNESFSRTKGPRELFSCHTFFGHIPFFDFNTLLNRFVDDAFIANGFSTSRVVRLPKTISRTRPVQLPSNKNDSEEDQLDKAARDYLRNEIAKKANFTPQNGSLFGNISYTEISTTGLQNGEALYKLSNGDILFSTHRKFPVKDLNNSVDVNIRGNGTQLYLSPSNSRCTAWNHVQSSILPALTGSIFSNIPEGLKIIRNWFLDTDNDSFHQEGSEFIQQSNSPGAGWTEGFSKGVDCDDENHDPTNNCVREDWALDRDNDNHYDSNTIRKEYHNWDQSSSFVSGFKKVSTLAGIDCDDDNKKVHDANKSLSDILLYDSPRQPGKDEKGNIARDFKSGDLTTSDVDELISNIDNIFDRLSSFKKYEIVKELNNIQLIGMMRRSAFYTVTFQKAMGRFSDTSFQNNLDSTLEMINRLAENRGGIRDVSENTRNLLRNDSGFNRYINKVKTEIEKKLKDLESLDNFSNLSISVGTPVFSQGGNKFTWNDSWSVKLNLKNIRAECSEIMGILSLEIFDHFGLDTGDMFSSQSSSNARKLSGFWAWFQLQRVNGLAPFINRFSTTEAINVTIK